MPCFTTEGDISICVIFIYLYNGFEAYLTLNHFVVKRSLDSSAGSGTIDKTLHNHSSIMLTGS